MEVMDPQRFDGIARHLATSSRRRVLAGLAAAALTSLAPRLAGAACQEGSFEQFACGTRECVGGEFVETFEGSETECRPAEGECDAAEFCTGASLACPLDRNLPNGTTCTDDGDVCTDNVCQGGQCVAVANDAACADDGNPCTNDICAEGICTHPAKQNGTTCPGGACCGGQCVDRRTNAAHCGGCGVACVEGRACCAGACVNLASGRRHCGRCGKRCRRGKRCRGGRCR
jgi:hypothetical protein